jgi:hypothetical protein
MTVKLSETDTQSDRPAEVTQGDNTERKMKMSAHQEEKADSDAKGDVKTTSAVTCPLLKIPQYFCDWAGSLEDLEAHVIRDHASIVKQSTIFECSSLEHTVFLILLHKEVFLYCKDISTGGVVYVIVQQVGVTSEKYRYTVNFLGDDDTDEIILGYDVKEISEPFDKAFESGKCVAIAEERLRPFIRGDQMQMAVKIKKVLTHAQTEDIDMNSTVTCPLAKVSDDICAWVGTLGTLEEHVEEEHADVLSRGCVFGCDSLTNNVLLLLDNNEIFLYYKYISQSGVMFVIVQQVGVTNRKYGYIVELVAINDEDDILETFTAYKITEPFEPIFDNRRCMVIRIDSLGPYIEDGDLAMSVGIHELNPSVKETDGCEPEEEEQDNTMCPLKKIPEKSCPWVGPFRCLGKHVENTHEDVLKRRFCFNCYSLQDEAFLILLKGEIFLYYKYFSEADIMYVVVQQVGLTNKKYKYSIQISSIDRTVDSITFTSVMGRISEPFEDVFSAQGCLVVSSERLVPYVLYDEISMFVAISGLSP